MLWGRRPACPRTGGDSERAAERKSLCLPEGRFPQPLCHKGRRTLLCCLQRGGAGSAGTRVAQSLWGKAHRSAEKAGGAPGHHPGGRERAPLAVPRPRLAAGARPACPPASFQDAAPRGPQASLGFSAWTAALPAPPAPAPRGLQGGLPTALCESLQSHSTSEGQTRWAVRGSSCGADGAGRGGGPGPPGPRRPGGEAPSGRSGLGNQVTHRGSGEACNLNLSGNRAA